MTTFTGTKFNDALFDSGLFDSALSDHMPGLAGNDAPTADAGDRSVELAEHESATRSHADRAMLLHGDFSSLVDTDGKAGTDTVVEVELVGRLKADSNEVAVEGLTGRDDDISLEPTRFENVTRPHSDGAVLLHGDVSSLVDTDAAIAAATEELFGNYNFVRSEPTASELLVGGAGGAGSLLVSRGGGEVFSSYVTNGTTGTVGGNGNETKIVDIVDGTSNTLAFATNGVVESVNVKYTLFSNGDDDPVAGVARLAGADYGSDGGPLRDGDLLDVGDLLFGLAGNESVTADGGDGFVESAAYAGVTRPHADGVVTNINDPDTLATVIDDIYDGTSSTFVDGIDRNGNNALGTRNGGEVVSSDSYVINGTTGTISDSGNDARIADITDGTSNTALDASSKDAAYIFGRTDGSAASNVIEALAEKYSMFEGEADGLLPGDNGADRFARVADLGVHSVLHGGDVLDVGDLSVDLGAGDRVSSDSGPYTLADGIEYDVSKNVANGPAGQENLYGNVNNIDLWVGAVALDVGDVLVGVDAADDDGNHPVQTRTAGGSTPLPADSDGQANGIIAVLIGLYTDIQGPLDNANPTLD